MTELKQQYNKLIKLQLKAAEYLDNDSIPYEEREKRIPEYQELLGKLSALFSEIKRQGITYTQDDLFSGFKI